MRTAIALCLVLAAGCRSKSDRDELVEAVRAGTQDAELSHPRPVLSVKSLRESQAYYRDVLGFKLDWDHGDPPDFGSVSRGNAVLFVCQGCPHPSGSWTMIFARDVDALYDEYKGKNAIILMPPTNMPWGLREMKVADRDGNVLRFGSAIEH